MTHKAKSIEFDVAATIQGLFDVLVNACNRASYFPSFATQAVETLTETKKIKFISGEKHYEIIPVKEDIERTKSNFCFWVCKNGIRDAIETFLICIKRTYAFCSAVSNISDFKNATELETYIRKIMTEIDNDDVDKIKLKLRKEFGVTVDSKTSGNQVFFNLKKIRDCLAHNNGFVTERTGDNVEGNKKKVIWLTWKYYEKKGKKLKEIKKGHKFSEKPEIEVRLETHKKIYPLGAELKFTGFEAVEITHTINVLAYDLKTQLLNFSYRHNLIDSKTRDSKGSLWQNELIPEWNFIPSTSSSIESKKVRECTSFIPNPAH